MHIVELTERARARARAFSGMPEHQSLTYGVESVVDDVLPSRRWSVGDAQRLVNDACLSLGLDTPEVVRARIKRAGACADLNGYRIVLSGPTTSLVLAHELAHLTCGERGHSEEWRTEYVRFARRIVSVEHGALLHALYARVGLSADWT
jgi:hypothetical protein